MVMEPYLLRVETLEPIRCPELFEGDELVYVVSDVPVIAELAEVTKH
jgi:hypothetical protein